MVLIFAVAFHNHPRTADLVERLRNPRSKGTASKESKAASYAATAVRAASPKQAPRDRGLTVLDGFRLGVGLILAALAFWLVIALLVMVFGVDGQIVFGQLR